MDRLKNKLKQLTKEQRYSLFMRFLFIANGGLFSLTILFNLLTKQFTSADVVRVLLVVWIYNAYLFWKVAEEGQDVTKKAVDHAMTATKRLFQAMIDIETLLAALSKIDKETLTKHGIKLTPHLHKPTAVN